MAWVSCSFGAWSLSECVATFPPLVQVAFCTQDDHSCPESSTQLSQNLISTTTIYQLCLIYQPNLVLEDYKHTWYGIPYTWSHTVWFFCSLQWSDADRIECHHGTHWEWEDNVSPNIPACCESCECTSVNEINVTTMSRNYNYGF